MPCVVLMFFCPQLLGKCATLQWDGNIFRMAPDRYGPEGQEQFANDWWRHWFGGFGLATGGVFGKSQLSSCFPLTVVTCAKLIWETLQLEITNQNTTKEKYTEIFGSKRRKFLKSLQWCFCKTLLPWLFNVKRLSLFLWCLWFLLILCFWNSFKGSEKGCFNGAMSLVYFKGLEICVALIPHQPSGISNPLHKPTGKFHYYCDTDV